MAIDAVFPAASEVVMVFAGALAAGAAKIQLFGTHLPPGLSAYLALSASGTLGYLVGSCVGWWIGQQGGRPLLTKHGGWFHLTPPRLEHAEWWFAKWGVLGILVGRVVPLVRSFISIPAGVFEMPLLPYVWLTLIGSAVWAFGLAGVGWALGSSYARFDHGFKYAEYGVVFLVLVAGAIPLVARWRAAASQRRQDGPND